MVWADFILLQPCLPREGERDHGERDDQLDLCSLGQLKPYHFLFYNANGRQFPKVDHIACIRMRFRGGQRYERYDGGYRTRWLHLRTHFATWLN